MRRPILVMMLFGSSVASAQPSMTPSMPIDETPITLRKEGLIHGGVSLELLNLGAVQAFTSHGSAKGVDMGVALQIELGPHLAFKLPIEFGYGGSVNGAHYGELAIVPGVLYRFRDRNDQTWVPYVGGGFRFGVVSIGKTLVGEPLDPVAVACCHDLDWGHSSSSGHASDPYMEDASTTSGGMSPELWAGFAWNGTRWFSVQFAGALGYERLLGTSVIVARETIGARITF